MRETYEDDFMASAAQTAADLGTLNADATRMLMIANIVSSTLYVAAVIAAGLVQHNQGALILGISTAGANYLATMAQMVIPGWRTSIFTLVALSIALGACAGVSLLWW